MRESVLASRYFTITAHCKLSPCFAPTGCVSARDPGTTIASAGMTSGEPPSRCRPRPFTRSYTGVDRFRIVPCPSTARALHHGSFINAAIAAHQHVVFNDHRHRPHRLQHAADLRPRRDVTIPPDLRAASHQRVRIDHRALVHIRSHIHKHRRHAHHAAPNKRSIANARSTWHNTNSIANGRPPAQDK